MLPSHPERLFRSLQVRTDATGVSHEGPGPGPQILEGAGAVQHGVQLVRNHQGQPAQLLRAFRSGVSSRSVSFPNRGVSVAGKYRKEGTGERRNCRPSPQGMCRGDPDRSGV